LLQTVGHFLLYLTTGSVAYYFWSIQLWPAFGAALFFHGIVSSFLRGISTHELAHGTVFRTRWLNRVFLTVFSLLNWWNHVDYALSHTLHHRYTLHASGDREVLLPLKPVPGPAAAIQLFTVNLFIRPGRTFSSGGFFATVFRYLKSAFGIRHSPRTPSGEWLRALHDDQPLQARKSRRWCRVTLLFHVAVAAISAATGLWVLPILISVAPFIANFVLYSVALPQHCGLKGSNPDFRKCARSIRLGPVLTFLYWQMNWHAEHHMYAAVPCYNLKKLAREISADMPEPRSLRMAWKEMRETWVRQQSDPSYQFDLPLPASASPGVVSSANSDSPATRDADLENSIGELAPDGLS